MKKLLALFVAAMMVSAAWAQNFTDVLTASAFGVSGTAYNTYYYTSPNGVQYQALCATTAGALQLRSNSNNSGIIASAPNARVVSVEVVWSSKNTTARTLQVYGSQTPFSVPADLYGGGVMLGTIESTGGKDLMLQGTDYAYIGVRSASGALYADQISITWEIAGQGTTGQDTTTHVIPTDTTQYIPTDTTTHVIPTDTTQYIPSDTTQYIPSDTTHVTPTDTTHVTPTDTTTHVKTYTASVMVIAATGAPLNDQCLIQWMDPKSGRMYAQNQSSYTFDNPTHVKIGVVPQGNLAGIYEPADTSVYVNQDMRVIMMLRDKQQTTPTDSTQTNPTDSTHVNPLPTDSTQYNPTDSIPYVPSDTTHVTPTDTTHVTPTDTTTHVTTYTATVRVMAVTGAPLNDQCLIQWLDPASGYLFERNSSVRTFDEPTTTKISVLPQGELADRYQRADTTVHVDKDITISIFLRNKEPELPTDTTQTNPNDSIPYVPSDTTQTNPGDTTHIVPGDTTSQKIYYHLTAQVLDPTDVTSIAARPITNQCYIGWTDPKGEVFYRMGSDGGMYEEDTWVRVEVRPQGEAAQRLLPKDSIVQVVRDQMISIVLAPQQVPEPTPEDTTTVVEVETGCLTVRTPWTSTNGETYPVVIIFDAEGNFYGRSILTRGINHYAMNVCDMPVGEYTLIGIESGNHSNISTLETFSEIGLQEGVDYASAEFVIAANETALVDINVPTQPEEEEATTISYGVSVNKDLVFRGQRVDLTAYIVLERELANTITECSYVVTRPFVNETRASTPYSYTIGREMMPPLALSTYLDVPADHRLTDRAQTELRISIEFAEAGVFYSEVDFRYKTNNGDYGFMCLGFIRVVVEANGLWMDLQPNITSSKRFKAYGYAPANVTVNVVDGDGHVYGTTQSNAAGKWETECTHTATTNTTFELYAQCDGAFAPIQSEKSTLEYMNDVSVCAPMSIQMSHYNEYYEADEIVRWNLTNCTSDRDYYFYYHAADFTFTTSLSEDAEAVSFVVLGQDRSETRINASRVPGQNNVWASHLYIGEQQMPTGVGVVTTDTNGESHMFTACYGVRPIADPSGYVYEAVTNNRVEGATASAYYKENESDADGILWDAAMYGQVNPQTTDKAGRYAWDVPMGYWQVRFEKAEFEPACTEWLPVPPPQVEIRVPMVRLTAPVVDRVAMDADNATITFDRYMLPEDLTEDNIQFVSGGAPLAANVEILDKVESVPGSEDTLASRVRISLSEVPSAPVSLHINGAVRSYAGTPMGVDYDEEVTFVAAVNDFGQIDTIHAEVGQNGALSFYVLPASAAAGKTLRIEALTSVLYTLNSTSAVIGADGSARVSLQANLPGRTAVRVVVEDTELKTIIPVIITMPEAEQTGVQTAPVATDKAERILGTYDLSGRRMADDAPLAPGVYVRNGEKIVIR